MSTCEEPLFTTEEVFQVLNLSQPPVCDLTHQNIYAVCTDSREASPGSLFVALEGERTDGHLHINEAVSNGAVAALIDENKMDLCPDNCLPIPTDNPLTKLGDLAHWYRDGFSVEVVGITGSVGKTTCKDFIAAVLQDTYNVLKSSGNYNTEIGVPLTIFELEKDHDVAVIELAMRNRGDIEYLTDIAQPEVGVLTNIGESHIENLGSVENIARAKGELFEGLPDDGLAIINSADSWGKWIAELTPAKTIYYGSGGDARVWPENVKIDEWAHCRFELCSTDGNRTNVTLPLAGEHHVDNALAAACLGLVLGVPLEKIGTRLQQAELTGMRMQWMQSGQITILNDAYNSSPTSAKAALLSLSEVQFGQRKVAIMGDMLELGENSACAHEQIGKTIAQSDVDILLTVGEWAYLIAKGAIAEGLGQSSCKHYESNAELISDLSELIMPGDVVLIKGSRGCQLEQCVNALTEIFECNER